MDKILDELKKMEEINIDFKKSAENERTMKSKEKEIAKMYENAQLKMIGTEEREQALKEYEEKKNRLEKINELKKAGDKEIEEKFENKKKAIIEEIDKRLENYEKIEQEKEKMEEAKKERDEEVLKLEGQKNAYSKIAQNSKKDIANILEKLNNGERVSMDRLTDAQNEYKANVSKVISIENRIKELNDKEFEISEDIEKNPEEISDLQYLKSRIVGIKISELDKIKEDPFVEKYGKEERKDENDKPGENSEKGSNDGKDKSGENSGKDSNDEKDKSGENSGKDSNNEKDKSGENSGKGSNDEKDKSGENSGKGSNDEKDKSGENSGKGSNDEKDKSGENSGKGSNDENDKLGVKTPKYKDTIVLDAYNNKLVVNGVRKDYLEVFRKDGKKLKEDSDLAIGSLFAGDKKMVKYIDYGLLKALDDKDRNLALEYLNVIRGGGVKSSSESAEILKNAIDIKYKFNNDLNTFFSFRKKKIARKAVELGIAEIEGINDKSLAKRIIERMSKAKNIKLFGTKEKVKEIASGDVKTIAQQDKEKTIEKIKEDRANGSRIMQNVKVDDSVKENLNTVSKKYSETENEVTNEIGKDVRKIVAENNESEIGE